MPRIDVLTLFPDALRPYLEHSIPGRAAAAGLVSYHLADLRQWGIGNYKKVDDRPFGGGPGMVMTAPVLAAGVDAIEAEDPRPAHRILTSPRGKPFTQADAHRLAALPRLLIVCGHYEGVDERFADEYQPEEISLGDFVLSGGELAALCIIDAVVRLLPGVLGHAEGAADESFGNGTGQQLLEHPQYTRPRTWRGHNVPEILSSGDHPKIATWRTTERQRITQQRRPDLLDK